MNRPLAVSRTVMDAQRDLCEAQHHLLLVVRGDELTPVARAVIRMRLLSAADHLLTAAQEAERFV